MLTEDGAFALFYRPHPGGFDSSRIPTPGNLSSKAKNANARWSAGGGGGGELTDAKLHGCQRRRMIENLRSVYLCVVLHAEFFKFLKMKFSLLVRGLVA